MSGMSWAQWAMVLAALLYALSTALLWRRSSRHNRRMAALRDCTDELCRLSGRFEQIERSARFGVDVEMRARMHEDLLAEREQAIERHKRAFQGLRDE